MSTIVCVTSSNSIGCSFLDWSLHWLTGQTEFFNVDAGWEPLIDDPLQNLNAHNHPKNHPSGLAETLEVVNKLKGADGELLSFYPFTSRLVTALELLEIDISQVQVPIYYDQIVKFRTDEYAQIFNLCNECNIPIIYVKQNHYPVYQTFLRDDRLISNPTILGESVDEVKKDFLNIFFNTKDNIGWGDKFNNLPIWDQREFIALNIRPYDRTTLDYDQKINFSKPHFYLDSMDWWLNGEDKILEILSYLKLKLNTARYKKWIKVYRTWQKKQLKILNFCWNLDYICNSIVNNHYLDISSYNISMWEEAIIQHIMIYKYNLNFKSWQLDKFPSNTQDLHKLLEPNIHATDILYT